MAELCFHERPLSMCAWCQRNQIPKGKPFGKPFVEEKPLSPTAKYFLMVGKNFRPFNPETGRAA